MTKHSSLIPSLAFTGSGFAKKLAHHPSGFIPRDAKNSIRINKRADCNMIVHLFWRVSGSEVRSN